MGRFLPRMPVSVLLAAAASGSLAPTACAQCPPAFAVEHPYGAGSGCSALAVGDFNEDGWPDLATANYGGSVAVLLNGGPTYPGTFAERREYSQPSFGQVAIAVVRMDADPHLDLVFTDLSTGRVGVMLGRGDGTFGPAQMYPVGGVEPSSLAIADVNADGLLDVVTANSYSAQNDQPPIRSSISVLLGRGDGTLEPAMTIGESFERRYSVAAGDLNGDGFVDLVSGNLYGIAVFFGLGGGAFGPPLTRTLDTSTRTVSLSDLDGDGALAVVVSSYDGPPIAVFRGDGHGGLEGPRYFGGPYHPTFAVAADFDADGRLDLAVVGGEVNGVVSILRGMGGGTYAAPVYFGAGEDPVAVVAFDADGDGLPDAVVADRRGDRVSVCRNNWCAVDINCDQFVDFFDLDQFVDAFEAGLDLADFNHDQFIDFFDFDAFIEAFELGCNWW